jgi:hypothetical protein
MAAVNTNGWPLATLNHAMLRTALLLAEGANGGFYMDTWSLPGQLRERAPPQQMQDRLLIDSLQPIDIDDDYTQLGEL